MTFSDNCHDGIQLSFNSHEHWKLVMPDFTCATSVSVATVVSLIPFIIALVCHFWFGEMLM
jgi:hypothetical protein